MTQYLAAGHLPENLSRSSVRPEAMMLRLWKPLNEEMEAKGVTIFRWRACTRARRAGLGKFAASTSPGGKVLHHRRALSWRPRST